MEKTAVIIPTYNSSKTIAKLLSLILKFTDETKIFIVDDNSPDNTNGIIEKNFPGSKRITILHREKKGGRGSAVIYGIKYALKNKRLKYFVEMDSDLVHNPKYIPNLVDKCRDCDVVIASRYIKDSKNINWKLKRQLFSRAVSLYLKVLLNIPITDYTNGFRCYKRQILENLDFDKVKSKGFFVLTELSYLLFKKNARFCEIPFTFKLVELSKSNLSLNELKEAFFSALRLKLS